MKIGIFGGSFNPPHKIHLKMVTELLDKGHVDKIIFVPTGNKYKYKRNLVADVDRFNMIKLMIKNDQRFDVSNFELQDRNVYTYETLDYFKKTYPDDEIFFICGADNLSYVDKWMNGLELLKNNKFIVVKRDTDDIDELLKKFNEYRENIIVSDVLPSELSSTFIREKIFNGENVEMFLDKDVLKYIKENKLYE